jgi:hypothetical protein
MSAIDASAPLRLRHGVSDRSAAEARRRRGPRAPGGRKAPPVPRRSPAAARRSPLAGPHEASRPESPSRRAVSAGSGATRSSASGGGAEPRSRPRPPWLGTIHQKDAIDPRTSTAERGAPNRRHDALPGRRRSVPARAGHRLPPRWSARAGPRLPPRWSSLGGEGGVAMGAIDASAPQRLRRGVSDRSAAEARRRRCPRAPGGRKAPPDARLSPFAGRHSPAAARRPPRRTPARVAFATGRFSRFGRHSEQCLRRRCRGTLPPASSMARHHSPEGRHRSEDKHCGEGCPEPAARRPPGAKAIRCEGDPPRRRSPPPTCPSRTPP